MRKEINEKIKVYIDYPVGSNNDYKGLSFPQVLYDFLKYKDNYEVITNPKPKNVDIIVIINGGSHYDPEQKQIIRKINNLTRNRISFFSSYLNLLLKKIFKYHFLKSRHTYYEKRFNSLLKDNPSAKIVHRLDDRYKALCKVYGYDYSIMTINKRVDVTVHQSDYCQKIWEHGIKTIFGWEDGFKTKNPVRIDNGVNVGIFNPNGETIELKGKYKIIHVAASGNPRKGLKSLLFFAEMLINNPEFQFYLVGRQETDPLDGHRISDFKNVHKLEFTSNREMLATYYRSCDIMLFPSIGDCSPNVVLEAMACGIPVIAANSGGTPEMIIKDKMHGGTIIDEDNPILSLKLISENLDEFSENAVNIIRHYHSIEVMGEKYSSLFKEMINGNI